MRTPVVVLITLLITGAAYNSHGQCCVLSNSGCDAFSTEPERQQCWFSSAITNVYGLSIDDVAAFYNVNAGKASYYVNKSNAPWGGNYFSSDSNGIARRWSRKVRMSPLTRNVTSSDFHNKNLDYLSPVEKYDLYAGNKSFEATNREMAARGVLRANPSEHDGYCNGIRAAGVLTQEPLHAITVSAKDRNNIKFKVFPADIKALLAAAYFYPQKYNSIGCAFSTEPECDIDARLFDIALRFILGEKGQCFFIDTNPTLLKFNQTVIGYNRKTIFNENKCAVHLTLYTLEEVSVARSNKPTTDWIATSKPLAGTKSSFRKYEYDYELVTNSAGMILSGNWVSTVRPDYVWFASGRGDDAIQTGPNAQMTNENISYDKLMQLLALSRQ